MNPQATGLCMILVAMAVESFAQLALKVGAAGGPRILRGRLGRWAVRQSALASARMWLLAGIIGYGLEVLFYTLALSRLDVTVAFPLGSLCFVGVALLSRIFLGEAVSPIRWLGVACILAGTAFLAV